jgi:hypothetical protein
MTLGDKLHSLDGQRAKSPQGFNFSVLTSFFLDTAGRPASEDFRTMKKKKKKFCSLNGR